VNKELMYRTAFSPLYNAFVGIKNARQDKFGQYIFVCHVNGHPPDKIISFRKCELTRFVL